MTKFTGNLPTQFNNQFPFAREFHVEKTSTLVKLPMWVWVDFDRVMNDNSLMDQVVLATPLLRHYIGKDWNQTRVNLETAGYTITEVK